MVRRFCLGLSLALVTTAAACGGGSAIPAAGGTRESGQSHLMDSTFAGKNQCNPANHDRPFVVEWDATDASSFQARTANDIVFVKYEGCNLTVIDSCSDDSVRGSFGSYKPIDWTAGAVEKVDVDNMVDLYAKLPLGVALLGGRVESGEKFHMEYFVSGTRSATRPAIYAADLAKNPGCNGVTHFVYGYNLGAFALGSQSKIAGHAGGTVWGAGAGGDAKYASAVEKKGGDLSSCTGASAHELDTCKVPVRLTLRAITPGESPDHEAARAPETPDALNLAGKLQASNEQQRNAAEHWQAAQTKMQSGDGKGCLAELDTHDKLDTRPEGLSTNVKAGGAHLRAICVMLTGQCAAGRAMARKAFEVSSSQLKPEEIDRIVDGTASTYCRGSLSDRDTLLRAIHVFQAQSERVTVADCQRAYDGAMRVIDKVPAKDNMDPVSDARHTLLLGAPKCFARAGDCVSAWRIAKEQDEAYSRVRSYASTDHTKRSMFVTGVGSLCFDKDQGKLTDAETVFRSVAELGEARETNPPTPAFCEARIAAGKAALPRALAASHGDDLKYEPDHLAKAGAECLAMANDCPSAWKRYAEIERAFPIRKPDELERGIRGGFREAARSCQFKPQGAMTPNETVYWAAGVLEDGTRTRIDARACTAAFEDAKRAAPAFVGDKAINSSWHYGTRDIPQSYGRCMEKASDCQAAWKAFQAAFPIFSSHPESEPAKIRSWFESSVSACRGK